jgi:hypothetical protein
MEELPTPKRTNVLLNKYGWDVEEYIKCCEKEFLKRSNE